MKTSGINSGLNGQRPIRSLVASPLANEVMGTTNIELIELANVYRLLILIVYVKMN